MNILKNLFSNLILILTTNIFLIVSYYQLSIPISILLVVVSLVFYLLTNISNFGIDKNLPKSLKTLQKGNNLILSSFILVIVNSFTLIYSNFNLIPPITRAFWVIQLVVSILLILGMIINSLFRLYVSSLQLGIKKRVLFIIFWWIPVVNIYFWIDVFKTTFSEFKVEKEKFYLNESRKNLEICSTKYPILLVHGVFFRDSNYFNYWGRIPKELEKNGAKIFYGDQESAGSIEDCGKQVAKRINEIVEQTGCEKVNIIAHSKGGLDSRYAISNCGVASKVATLTTINTPHYGCDYVDYLFEKVPSKIINKIAKTYNFTLKKVGDKNPDFITAITNLTKSYIEEFNKSNPNSSDVYYQSFGSIIEKLKKDKRKKFPLNLSFLFIKFFNKSNDGLVSLDSMKWNNFTFVDETGLSHADMIDLFRENIDDFDIREFYVKLVSDLKESEY
ncbi:esterase/lipase family protein [Miniphocaeibacter massiliensis]|uniref:esterase/lipase family protein n=1 Tax=Miniphocaeibacter massiliensis TaxID=2041841 RepID=UPI000C1BB1C9|nr:triacylglycerol lipase [Miniphocaeibacter massiliensis]